VEDLGSSNGTMVNGERVERAELKDGDTLTLGKTRLCLKGPVTGAPAGASGAARTKSAPDDEQVQLEARPAAPLEKTQKVPAMADQDRSAVGAARGLGGRYELSEIIHQGSSGMFYKAKDLKSGRTVCVKVLTAGVAGDETELKRFVRGVRTAAKLHHPNIVQLYRAGRSGRQWWLAMEFVDGSSLRQVIAKYGVGNMLAPARVLAIARDITAALEVAYERQVLHRNIRPENILLTKRGMAKLSDFTLVRGVVLSTMQRITGSSELVGDLAYMGPERTEPDGVVDCRSDIYALGACLYSLLAGRPPFTGRGTVHLIELIRHEMPAPPSRLNLSVPGPLEAIVMKCLAKSPSDRFESPMELREELARVSRFQGMWT
jgi:serine/threonine-protein kinase